MSSVADYVGRTTDMLAFQGAAAGAGDQLMLQSLVTPTDSGMVTTGVQKLAQRVLLILLTRRGSLIYSPGLGCDFMRDAHRGAWRTGADIDISFNSAKLDIVRQVRGEELDSDSDDERLASLNLLGAALDDGQAVLRISLVTVAGSTVTFIAPIPLVIRP